MQRRPRQGATAPEWSMPRAGRNLQLASRPNRSASAYSEPMAGSVRTEPSGHLVGRDAETELLDTLIAGLRDGGGALAGGAGRHHGWRRVRDRACLRRTPSALASGPRADRAVARRSAAGAAGS